MIYWIFENRFNPYTEVATSSEPNIRTTLFPTNRKNIHQILNCFMVKLLYENHHIRCRRSFKFELNRIPSQRELASRK